MKCPECDGELKMIEMYYQCNNCKNIFYPSYVDCYWEGYEKAKREMLTKNLNIKNKQEIKTIEQYYSKYLPNRLLTLINDAFYYGKQIAKKIMDRIKIENNKG